MSSSENKSLLIVIIVGFLILLLLYHYWKNCHNIVKPKPSVKPLAISNKNKVVLEIYHMLNCPHCEDIVKNKQSNGKTKLDELKGKPILYYKELGEPSHATALDYLINKYDWNKNQEEEKQPTQIQSDKQSVKESVENKEFLNSKQNDISYSKTYSEKVEQITKNDSIFEPTNEEDLDSYINNCTI